jgi:Ca2+-binding RTX toxin-like protein
MTYRIPIANGIYDVNLLFVENVFTETGDRVFDVSIENQLVLDNFDIWDQYGILDRLIPMAFEDIEVTDGVLNLDFQSSASNAFTLAIEVLRPGLEITDPQGTDSVLTGGESNDVLFGVADTINPGVGEIDTLTGNGGVDTFVLGDVGSVFYNDRAVSGNSSDSYALITDFSMGQQDIIQLKGAPSQYQLGSSSPGLPEGTAIFYQGNVQQDLIAIVQGATNLSLASPSFQFV